MTSEVAIGDVILLVIVVGVPVTIMVYAFRAMRSSRKEDRGLCPTCGYDLRASRRHCPECGARITNSLPRHIPLRDDWPAAPLTLRNPAAGETTVLIYETENKMEADLLQQQFEARGVECRLNHAEVKGLPGKQRVFSELVIWSGDVARAKAILSQLLKDV